MNTVYRYLERKREDGAAMIFAVLISLVMIGLIAGMASYSIRSLNKGTNVQTLNSSINAADSAIANMMTLANSGNNANSKEIDKHLGLTNAVYGQFQANELDPISGDGQYKWRWYAEKETTASKGTSYIVYATGYQKTPDESNSRTIRVNIESTSVEGIEYGVDGAVKYIATKGGSFGFAAFGDQYVDMGENAYAKLYDSNKIIGYPTVAMPENQAMRAEISSSKNFILGKPSTPEITPRTVVFLGKPNGISSFINLVKTFCSGPGCAKLNGSLYEYGMSLGASRTEALAKCPLPSYPDWRASTSGGTISTGGTTKCYNNIIFDQDTTLPASWSTGNPAIMYAKGNVTVSPGVEVAAQRTTSQGPFALQIIASGTTNFTMERSSTPANPTKFTGVVVGAGLHCDIGGEKTNTDIHGTQFYGSLACSSVKVQKNSTLWRDIQLDKVLKEGSMLAKNIWTATSYEEI